MITRRSAVSKLGLGLAGLVGACAHPRNAFVPTPPPEAPPPPAEDATLAPPPGDDAPAPRQLYVINADECIDCGACEPECPVSAINETDDGGYAIDPATCTGEGACVQVCPVDCIALAT